MRIRKRISSLAVVLALVLGMLPVTASAQGSDNFPGTNPLTLNKPWISEDSIRGYIAALEYSEVTSNIKLVSGLSYDRRLYQEAPTCSSCGGGLGYTDLYVQEEHFSYVTIASPYSAYSKQLGYRPDTMTVLEGIGISTTVGKIAVVYTTRTANLHTNVRSRTVDYVTWDSSYITCKNPTCGYKGAYNIGIEEVHYDEEIRQSYSTGNTQATDVTYDSLIIDGLTLDSTLLLFAKRCAQSDIPVLFKNCSISSLTFYHNMYFEDCRGTIASASDPFNRTEAGNLSFDRWATYSGTIHDPQSLIDANQVVTLQGAAATAAANRGSLNVKSGSGVAWTTNSEHPINMPTSGSNTVYVRMGNHNGRTDWTGVTGGELTITHPFPSNVTVPTFTGVLTLEVYRDYGGNTLTQAGGDLYVRGNLSLSGNLTVSSGKVRGTESVSAGTVTVSGNGSLEAGVLTASSVRLVDGVLSLGSFARDTKFTYSGTPTITATKEGINWTGIKSTGLRYNARGTLANEESGLVEHTLTSVQLTGGFSINANSNNLVTIKNGVTRGSSSIQGSGEVVIDGPTIRRSPEQTVGVIT